MPEALTDLFTEDGVRLGRGSRPLVGKKAILAENQKQMARHPQGKVFTYKPEVHDLQIVNETAARWGASDDSISMGSRPAAAPCARRRQRRPDEIASMIESVLRRGGWRRAV
jgi:hypothetical protein